MSDKREDKKEDRLSYEESCRWLQLRGYLDFGRAAEIPPMPDHRPACDDPEPLGVSFFRTQVEGDYQPGHEEEEDHMQDLTLPRTFFGLSLIEVISFRNTDLRESTLCWNNFQTVNFAEADLSGCDLRASIYRKVEFTRANLRNADLRLSSFEDCSFTGADMCGAKLTREQAGAMELSQEQRQQIDWQESEGDLPPGG